VIQERLTNTAGTVNRLDNEMAVIRDEILSAQKLFKMKSGTVNDILDHILNLRKLKQDALADAYEQEFQAISAKEDLIQLILLKKELESEVGRIKGDAL
jgi:putative GTP pyrophosphokinase